jgi:hypothetical protein
MSDGAVRGARMEAGPMVPTGRALDVAVQGASDADASRPPMAARPIPGAAI